MTHRLSFALCVGGKPEERLVNAAFLGGPYPTPFKRVGEASRVVLRERSGVSLLWKLKAPALLTSSWGWGACDLGVTRQTLSFRMSILNQVKLPGFPPTQMSSFSPQSVLGPAPPAPRRHAHLGQIPGPLWLARVPFCCLPLRTLTQSESSISAD